MFLEAGDLQKESSSSQAKETFLQSAVELNTPKEQASDPNDTQLSVGIQYDFVYFSKGSHASPRSCFGD